eukprot:1153469-Pelagomonas_calceolata.AAC.4
MMIVTYPLYLLALPSPAIIRPLCNERCVTIAGPAAACHHSPPLQPSRPMRPLQGLLLPAIIRPHCNDHCVTIAGPAAACHHPPPDRAPGAPASPGTPCCKQLHGTIKESQQQAADKGAAPPLQPVKVSDSQQQAAHPPPSQSIKVSDSQQQAAHPPPSQHIKVSDSQQQAAQPPSQSIKVSDSQQRAAGPATLPPRHVKETDSQPPQQQPAQKQPLSVAGIELPELPLARKARKIAPSVGRGGPARARAAAQPQQPQSQQQQPRPQQQQQQQQEQQQQQPEGGGYPGEELEECSTLLSAAVVKAVQDLGLCHDRQAVQHPDSRHGRQRR